jgi:hypothetical protein
MVMLHKPCQKEKQPVIDAKIDPRGKYLPEISSARRIKNAAKKPHRGVA